MTLWDLSAYFIVCLCWPLVFESCVYSLFFKGFFYKTYTDLSRCIHMRPDIGGCDRFMPISFFVNVILKFYPSAVSYFSFTRSKLLTWYERCHRKASCYLTCNYSNEQQAMRFLNLGREKRWGLESHWYCWGILLCRDTLRRMYQQQYLNILYFRLQLLKPPVFFLNLTGEITPSLFFTRISFLPQWTRGGSCTDLTGLQRREQPHEENSLSVSHTCCRRLQH